MHHTVSGLHDHGNVHLTRAAIGSPEPPRLWRAAAVGDSSDGLRSEVTPAIVKIMTDKSVGSGFFVDANGMVATVAHNVLGSKRIVVQTSDHRLHEARIVKMNDLTDVAELKVEMNGARSKFLNLGASTSLKSGQPVNGFGFAGKDVDQAKGVFLHPGIPLSYINRDRVEHSLNPDMATLKDFIQAMYTPVLETSVHRDPGDSGGALVDDKGNAIGLSESQEPGVLGNSHSRRIEDFKALVNDRSSKFVFDYVPDCGSPMPLPRFGVPVVPICKPPLANHPPELYRTRRADGDPRPPFDWLKVFPVR